MKAFQITVAVFCVTLGSAFVSLMPAFAQATAQSPAAVSQQADPATVEPVGNVATLRGSATVTRKSVMSALKISDDVFKDDLLQTGNNSTMGVTFNDDTTLNLTSNSRIAVDNFVYEEGGKKNAALFNIALGTIAFVASAVARTGDMKISTPTATLGIRGTTGLVEVPEGGSAGNVGIKLYPDQDGKVGHIEVNGRDGTRLGLLSQGATGFAIRPGAGGRFAAIPLQISPQQVARDRNIVQQVHAAQSVGHQVVAQQRVLRQQRNPQTQPGPQKQPVPQNRRPGLPKQPGLQKQPVPPNQRSELPKQPGLQKQALPQNERPALPKQPDLQRRPGLQNQTGPQNLPRPLVQRPGRRNSLVLPPRRKPLQIPEERNRGRRPL